VRGADPSSALSRFAKGQVWESRKRRSLLVMLKALHSTVRRRIDSELSFQCLSVKAYRLSCLSSVCGKI
jgi:hypothetical protein